MSSVPNQAYSNLGDETPNQPSCGFDENLAWEVADEAVRKTLLRSVYISRKKRGGKKTAEEPEAAQEIYFTSKRRKSFRRAKSVLLHEWGPAEKHGISKSKSDDIIDSVAAELQDMAQNDVGQYATVRRRKSITPRKKTEKGERERALTMPSKFYDKPGHGSRTLRRRKSSASFDAHAVESSDNSPSTSDTDSLANDVMASLFRVADKDSTVSISTPRNSMGSPCQDAGEQAADDVDFVSEKSHNSTSTPVESLVAVAVPPETTGTPERSESPPTSVVPVAPPLPSNITSKFATAPDSEMTSDEDDEDNPNPGQKRRRHPGQHRKTDDKETFAVISELEAEKIELEYLVEHFKDRVELLEVDFDDTNMLFLEKKTEAVRLAREKNKLEETVRELRYLLQIRETVLQENGVLLPRVTFEDEGSMDNALSTARELFQKALASTMVASCHEQSEQIKKLQAEREHLLLSVENSCSSAPNGKGNSTATVTCADCSRHSEEVVKLRAVIQQLEAVGGVEGTSQDRATVCMEQSFYKELSSLQKENQKLQAALADLHSSRGRGEVCMSRPSADYSAFTEKLTALQEENVQLKAQLESAEMTVPDKLTVVLDEKQQLEATVAKLQVECSAAHEALTKSSDTCSHLSSQISLLQKDSQQLALLRKRENDARQLAAEVSQLSEHLLYTEDWHQATELTNLKECNTQLTHELEKCRKELNSNKAKCSVKSHPLCEDVKRLQDENGWLRAALYETSRSGSNASATKLQALSQGSLARSLVEGTDEEGSSAVCSDPSCTSELAQSFVSLDEHCKVNGNSCKAEDKPLCLGSLEELIKGLRSRDENRELRSGLQDKIDLLIEQYTTKAEEVAFLQEENVRLHEENSRLQEEVASYPQVYEHQSQLSANEHVLMLQHELTEVRDQLQEEQLWLERTAEKLMRVEYQNIELQTRYLGTADSFANRGKY